MIQTGAAMAGIVAIPIAGPVLGISLGGLGMNWYQFGNFLVTAYQARKVVARIHTLDGRDLIIRQGDVRHAKMLRAEIDRPWGISVKHRKGGESGIPWWRYDSNDASTDLRGENAVHAATQLLPHVNHKGASPKVVKEAVKLATGDEDPDVLFNRAVTLAAGRFFWRTDEENGLSRVPEELRLAVG